MLARLQTEFASISDGVGVVLERRLATASAAGVGRFTATCLARNPAIICLLSRLGPTTVGRSDARLVDLRIDLTTTRPARPPSRWACDGQRY